MHVVLVEPEIPPNTGNIARTCAATSTSLHLVKPLGFSTDDRFLKRAGLDYWHLVQVHYHDSLTDLFQKYSDHPFALVTTKSGKFFTSASYGVEDLLIFGKETRGLPGELLAAHPERCIRIPMRAETRSLNLSNAVAIVLFEALRQQGFPGLI